MLQKNSTVSQILKLKLHLNNLGVNSFITKLYEMMWLIVIVYKTGQALDPKVCPWSWRCISNANPILEMKRKFILCACVFFQDFQLCVFCQDIWEYDPSRHTAGLNVHQRDLSFHWSTQLWHLITVSIINCRIWNSWKIHHISHFILATIVGLRPLVRRKGILDV